MKRLLTYALALLVVVAGRAVADDDLDVTMRMVTEDESASESVAREIRLPDSAGAKARESAAPGLERASEASERGRKAAESARDRANKGLERRSERQQIPGISSPDEPGGEQRPDRGAGDGSGPGDDLSGPGNDGSEIPDNPGGTGP